MSTRNERADALDRFSTPLYTVPEAARYLDVPVSTLTTWTHGYRRKPVARREVVGARVLTAMRRSGVPLQRIRPALERLDGQPIFARGGTRLDDVLALFRAGEPLDVVAEEYGVPREQLEDAVRVATRPAA